MIALLTLLALAAPAPEVMMPPAPPQIRKVRPLGGRRGQTVTLRVQGVNLDGVTSVLFDDPRLVAKVVETKDQGAEQGSMQGAKSLPGQPIVRQSVRKHELTVELRIAADTPLGAHGLRVVAERGATNRASFAVGDLPEVGEAEPNDAARPQVIALPATLTGIIEGKGTMGDDDHFAFDCRAGETLVFQVVSGLGSKLDPALALLGRDGAVVARTEERARRDGEVTLVHQVARAGRLVLQVSDVRYEASGEHHYRISAGALPLVTSVSPLGAPRGATVPLALGGHNLGAARRSSHAMPPAAGFEEALPVTVRTAAGPALGRVRIVADRGGTIAEREPNDVPGRAQALPLPGSVDGALKPTSAGAGASDVDLYRFGARRGEELVFSVAAERIGSTADAELAIVDERGRELPRALLRPVLQTTVSLRNQSGVRPGIRFDSMTGFQPGDFVLIGQELLRIADVPYDQPDMDVQMAAWKGQRRPFLGTSSQGHPLGSPIYRVEVHPPGTALPSNGMPSVTLPWRNDDGGPGFGRDPRLRFRAPADGVYFVRVQASVAGPGHRPAYRLMAGPPGPDFALTAAPADVNVPRGGSVAVAITAQRFDELEGPIEVELHGLPAGVRASRGVIRAGEDMVAVIVSAAPDAPGGAPAPLSVRGRASVAGRVIERDGRSSADVAVIAVRPAAEVEVVSALPSILELPAGGTTHLRLRVRRAPGYNMRIPVVVHNLPSLVKVPDLGLNGILINEQETEREITITAHPDAVPGEQTLVPAVRVETSGRPLEFAGPPVKLRVLPRPAPTAAR